MRLTLELKEYITCCAICLKYTYTICGKLSFIMRNITRKKGMLNQWFILINSPVLPFIIITKCTEQRAALPDVRNAKNQPESLCCFFIFFALFIFAQAREINYYATFRSHSSTLSKKNNKKKQQHNMQHMQKQQRRARVWGTEVQRGYRMLTGRCRCCCWEFARQHKNLYTNYL